MSTQHRLARTCCALLLVTLSACGERESPPPRRSVLLVTIDTLRADRLGCTGHSAARTPRIDALAQRGQLFTQAVAPTPLTLPSHATLLSGRLPIEHGARDNKPFRFPSDRFDTVATSLKERAYATLAIIGGEPLARGCGLEAAFDVYDDAFARAPVGSVRLGERTADAVTDAALAALDGVKAEQPFFLWTHYFDPHDPYVPPQDVLAQFRDAPYDGEIAFVDRELGRLLDGIASRGRANDLIVVVTADHGESLGEHGEARHGFFVYDATIRVPLIVTGPGIAPARIDEQVRLQDLRACIEALAASTSIDLTEPARRGEPAVLESLYGQLHCEFAQLRGLRHPNGSKYLEAGREEWYRWRDDPGEQRDLLGPPAAVDPAELAAARATLDDALRGAAVPSGADGIGEVGYLGMASAPGSLRTRSRTDNARSRSPRDRAASIQALTEGVRLLELGQA
ncbi:MAG: sulfatase, partial [Planctomycetes bacterium]|nr:sulfatase [Planctomycetota bacterium]